MWIGNSQDAADERTIRENGINAILNVAQDLPCTMQRAKGIKSYHCGLRDCEENLLTEYYSALLSLHSLVRRKKTVLVHCHGGRSRSALVVCSHLVLKGRYRNLAEAEEYVRSVHAATKIHEAHKAVVTDERLFALKGFILQG